MLSYLLWVVPCKGGQIKCDSDCLNYKSMGICLHSEAVAQVNNDLQQFINAFVKTEYQILLALLYMVCRLEEVGKENRRHVHERK